MLGVVLAGTAYATNTQAANPPDSAAHRYVPADGAVSYARVDTTRELRTTTDTQVTESAVLSGYTGLLSTDTTFGVKALGPVYDQGPTIRIWRTTSTVLDDPVVPQTTRVYRTNDGVELLGESRATGGYAYQPGLLELPPDVAAGHAWNSAGSAGDTLDYRSDLRAEAAPDDCLRVTGQIRYATKQGQQNRVVGLDRTWCPGRGITAASQSFGDIAETSTPVPPPTGPPPTGPPVTTTDIPIRWSDPQGWTAGTGTTVSNNAAYGEGPMSGTSLTAVTPVRTESGLVIRALAAPTDLIATTVKDSQTSTTTWRAHPGGAILSMAAFGNVVVVTTSERQMVGYSDRGARLWQLDLDELAPTAPLRVSDTDAVLVDLGGDVRRFDLATGVQDWQRNVGSDVAVSAAVGAGLVVVADRSSTITGLDAATGEQRWTQELDGKAAAVVGDTVIVVQDQTAHGLSVGSGEHRWLRHYDGTLSKLAAFGDGFLLATSTGSVLLDRGGIVRATLAGYLDLTVTPDLAVGWGTNRAEVLEPNGRVVATWVIPSTTVVSELRPGLATPDGVRLFNLDWTWGSWTHG